MKRYSPVAVLILVSLYLSTTGFQCGSAEVTTAKLAIQQGQYDKAEQSLAKEVQKNDKNEEAWFLLGQVRWEMKKYAEANEAFTKALALSDTHKNEIANYRVGFWTASINEGVQAYNKGRSNPAEFDNALQKFTSAVTAIPESSSGYYFLSLAQAAKNDLAGAEASLKTAIARKPGYREAIDRLGAIYLKKAEDARAAGNTAAEQAALGEAAAHFEQSLKNDPGNGDYILALIDVYQGQKETEKALALTRDAVATDPSNRTFRYAYGLFLLNQEKFGEAIEHLSKVGNAPGDTADIITNDAIYNLGVANLNWGVAMKAESDKQAEAARVAGKKNFKEDMSYKEKLKAALPFLEKAAETRSQDALLWQSLGRLYANLNMVEKSKAAFDRADQLMK